jgi:hypothetical protein
MSEHDNPSLDERRHAMVEALMGIIGAPDDASVADAADALVQELDAAAAARG